MKPPRLQTPDSRLVYMLHALRLAEQGLGQVWPNPTVGCVIVKQSRVVGVGRTARGGRPHAETQALAMAGADARGATLYVTLEPCAHHGATPPCAEAIIAAGVADVVVACRDPDSRVNGAGLRMLEDAGIRVVSGQCEEEARELNQGFFSRIQRGRPWVTLKVATSAEGFIAPVPTPLSPETSPPSKARREAAGFGAEPHSNIFWITGNLARRHSHLLRARHDAIVTGSGTVLADDPQLTCRLAGMEDRSPVRVLLDRRGRVPETARIFGPEAETWKLESGIKNLEEVLVWLGQKGITRLMIEAGSELNGAFLREGLIDEIYHYQSCLLLETGLKAFAGEVSFPTGEVVAQRRLGEDCLTVFRLTSNIK